MGDGDNLKRSAGVDRLRWWAATRLGRAGRRPVARDVLFVYDTGGAWITYRCDHQVEQLAYLGRSTDVVRSDEVDLVAAVGHYDTFVLNRVKWTDRMAAFVEAADGAKKDVIFGTDDLIFEPELEPSFAFLETAAAGDHARWRAVLERYRQTLSACDAAIVSTEPLADHARQHVADVRVVHNAVSEEMVRLADQELGMRSHAEGSASDRDVTIGYLSGTPSHNRDFREAADAVLWALATYPHVQLLIVGQLDLDERFEPFHGRLTRVPKQPLHELPRITARVDINLAPLERDNPVTECKSCVKYLEGGLVGVPTVASAMPDFVRVIEHGRNGLVADEAADWQAALGSLIESPELRRTLGRSAYDDVRARHTTKATAPTLARALGYAEPAAHARG